MVDDDLGRLRRENVRLTDEGEGFKRKDHLLCVRIGMKHRFIDTNRCSYYPWHRHRRLQRPDWR